MLGGPAKRHLLPFPSLTAIVQDPTTYDHLDGSRLLADVTRAMSSLGTGVVVPVLPS